MGGASPPRSLASTRDPHYPTHPHFATHHWPRIAEDPSDGTVSRPYASPHPASESRFQALPPAARGAPIRPLLQSRLQQADRLDWPRWPIRRLRRAAVEAPHEQPSAEVVDDANDLRGFHFRRPRRHDDLGADRAWSCWSPPASASRSSRSSALARRRRGAARCPDRRLLDRRLAAEDASFFEVYADQRQMLDSGKAAAAGRRRRCCARATTATPSASCRGRSPTASTAPSPSTPTRTSYDDSDGNRQTNYYRYTVGSVEVPECAAHRARALLPAQVRPAALEKFEDVFRSVKSGSSWRARRSTTATRSSSDEEQDPNWLRQLFSPTFIVWLTDSAPEKFAFELVDGTLCCYVNGHKEEGRRARPDARRHRRGRQPAARRVRGDRPL